MDTPNVEEGKIKKDSPKKVNVVDANVLDKKVPRSLLIKYGENYYILKAGLEWKAMTLYGGGNYSLETEIVEKTQGYVLAKATFTTRDSHGNPVIFNNFGEASKKNVPAHMHKYMLHMALTRAECRVLRMATACGYASYEEMSAVNGKTEDKEVPQLEDGDKPATRQQLATIKAMKGDIERSYTKQEASDEIKSLIVVKK